MTLPTDPCKVAKTILPTGHTQCQFTGDFKWHKRHGHAGGRMIERAIVKARARGFVSGAYGCFNTPDGGTMGSRGVLHHPTGWEIRYSSSYGAVAYDNSFSMSLHQVQVQITA